MSNGKIEMSYEEYKETGNNILKDIFNITKEDYEKGIEFINQIASYENKIEELASEIIPNNNICGYYVILEYCLKKIKENDKNLGTYFAKE